MYIEIYYKDVKLSDLTTNMSFKSFTTIKEHKIFLIKMFHQLLSFIKHTLITISFRNKYYKRLLIQIIVNISTNQYREII